MRKSFLHNSKLHSFRFTGPTCAQTLRRPRQKSQSNFNGAKVVSALSIVDLRTARPPKSQPTRIPPDLTPLRPYNSSFAKRTQRSGEDNTGSGPVCSASHRSCCEEGDGRGGWWTPALSDQTAADYRIFFPPASMSTKLTSERKRLFKAKRTGCDMSI